MSRKPDLLRSMLVADLNKPAEQPAKAAAPQVAEEPAGDTKPIQFRVSATMFEEFSEQAGREFGFSKGAKSRLFQKIWSEYQEKLRR